MVFGQRCLGRSEMWRCVRSRREVPVRQLPYPYVRRMSTTYTVVLTYVMAAMVCGFMLLWIPRRQKLAEKAYMNPMARGRLLVPMAERLRKQLSMVPVVVLPLMGTSFVVLAFVHGQLNAVESTPWFVPWFYGPLRGPHLWVFELIRLGLVALVLACAAFLAWPGPQRPGERRRTLTGLREDRIAWPWLHCGGFRRWLAWGCAMGAWLAVAAVLLLVPALMQLLIEVLGLEDQAAATLEKLQQDG